MSPGPLHPVGFWAPVGGDTINLTATGCSCGTTGGPVTADITCYNAGHSTRAGEVWTEDNCVAGYLYDIVDPVANAGDYQMKWDYLSGNAPYAAGSSTEATWIALSTTNFIVQWRAANGPTSVLGTVTVSIRKGTGATLATAVWDGEATLSGKGK